MWKTALLAAYTGLAIIFVILLASGKLGLIETVQPSASDLTAIPESEGLPKKEPWYIRDLPGSASATWYTYTHRDMFEKPDSEYIPLSCWYKHIRDLDPLYVYDHRGNIVVVLNRKGDIEEGKYIPTDLASYLPHTGDDGFESQSTHNKQILVRCKSGSFFLTRAGDAAFENRPAYLCEDCGTSIVVGTKHS